MIAIRPTSVARLCPRCQAVYPQGQAHDCPLDGPAAATNTEDDPLIGAVLGERYHIEGFLSVGGMGTVYRGRHLVLNQRVAIKVLRIIPDRETQERFLLEARTACSIGHLNIVRISDFGVLPDRRPFLVMEYLDGHSLEQIIAEHPRGLLSLRACRIGEQIALGMQGVHDKGIIHRDLKPGNIFVLNVHGKDFVKILDFGIAKVMSGQRTTLMEFSGGTRLTQDGAVLGTAWYMAPEQIRGEEVDHRVDQYALGCILYEMLTGEVPFDVPGNPTAVMLKHLTDKVAPLRSRRPSIPASLEQVVLRTLAKNPTERFPSMSELARALAQEAEELSKQNGQRPTTPEQWLDPDMALGHMEPEEVGEEERTEMILMPPLPIGEARQSSSVTPMSDTWRSTTIDVRVPDMRWLRPALVGAAAAVIGLMVYLAMASSESREQTRRMLPPVLSQQKTGGAPVPSDEKQKAEMSPARPRPVAEPAGPPLEEPPVAKSVGVPDPTPEAATHAAPRPLRVLLSSESKVPVTISCTGLPQTILSPGRTYQISLAPDRKGACMLSAPGYEDQTLSYRALRSRARGNTTSVPVRLKPL
ncbi:MAG: protein kinase [Myxococcales bacterium]|nr:protein kinase [Myxococcota bacterium]MDW8283233.1 protein kinase [Myxococcales bacterium]